MTLNNLKKIVDALEYEYKFGSLSDIDKKRFKVAVDNLKIVLNDRLGFPLYNEKVVLNDCEELKSNGC